MLFTHINIYRYEEFIFEVPEDEPFVPKTQTTLPDEVKIAVHVGPRQQLYALATIGMDDFDSLVSVFSNLLFAHHI